MATVAWTAVILLLVAVGGIAARGRGAHRVAVPASGTAADQTVQLTADKVIQLLDLGEQLSSGKMDAMYQNFGALLSNLRLQESHCKDNGTACQVCVKIPYMQEMCVGLKYLQKPSDVFVFSVSSQGRQLFGLEFRADKTPRVCILEHFCGQIVNMSLKAGELCGTVLFNGYPLMKNKCIPLQ